MKNLSTSVAVALMALALGARRRKQRRSRRSPRSIPTAISALQKMGEFLRDQQAFSVQARATTDDVLPSGQKVQYGGTVDLKIRRPDKMRMDIAGDRRNERMYYDGKTFTVFGDKAGFFATFPAPPTLAELKDVLEKRYAIDLPLADLFYWGTDTTAPPPSPAATRVGVANVDGFMADHYAFRQKDVDWELWIEQGGRPLPRKQVITTTIGEAKPQHSMVLNWDLAPKYDDQLFTFVPPANAHKIEFETTRRAGRPAQGRSAMTTNKRTLASRRRWPGAPSSRCRWAPPPRRRSSSAPRSTIAPPGARAPPSGPPRWSGRPPSSAASCARCRRRARHGGRQRRLPALRQHLVPAPVSGIPGHLRRRQPASALRCHRWHDRPSARPHPGLRPRPWSPEMRVAGGDGDERRRTRSHAPRRRTRTLARGRLKRIPVVSSRRRRASPPAPRASRACPAGGSEAIASGFGVCSVRPAGQESDCGPLVTVQPVPSLLQVRVNVIAPAWSRVGPTQVLTARSSPCGMSPPVAAPSARTPTSLSQVSLIETVSGSGVAVAERFVCVTTRTWFAMSPCRHANTDASSGMTARRRACSAQPDVQDLVARVRVREAGQQGPAAGHGRIGGRQGVAVDADRAAPAPLGVADADQPAGDAREAAGRTAGRASSFQPKRLSDRTADSS